MIPLAGTIGGGFFDGLLAGYAIKKVIKIVAVIVGLFIAALAYREYQRIIQVDWTSIQALSQSGITWLTNAVTDISNIGAAAALWEYQHIWEHLTLSHWLPVLLQASC